MKQQLFISIPVEESSFWTDDNRHHIYGRQVNGRLVDATVSFASKGKVIDFPATPFSKSQRKVMPTVFTIVVEGYMPVVYTGHFGDEVHLSLVRQCSRQ